MALIDNPNAIYLAHALYDECYKTQKLNNNNLCHICGGGMAGNAGQMPKSILNGFETISVQSPTLCYSHSMSWNVSFSKRFYDRQANKHIFEIEDLTLHFANFLAKTLIKLSKVKEKLNG